MIFFSFIIERVRYHSSSCHHYCVRYLNCEFYLNLDSTFSFDAQETGNVRSKLANHLRFVMDDVGRPDHVGTARCEIL